LSRLNRCKEVFYVTYGTMARYRVKSGMMQKLLDFEADIKEAGMKGFVAEFTLSTDEDPNVCYELVIFESKEAYAAVADDPEQDKRYYQLLALLEMPPEWHGVEVIRANPILARQYNNSVFHKFKGFATTLFC
jgi:hypothetical protein